MPDYAVTKDDMNVSPGDQMNASIYLTNTTTSQWYISIADLTTGQQYQNYTFYNSSQLSAEWIVERPEVNNRIGTLADFGDVTFANCQVVLGSLTGVISDFPYVVNVMYQNISFGREVAPLVTVSSLNSNGSSFDVTYLGG